MDDCTSALDCCNNAAKLAFEKDTEVEAQCEAFAGKIYYKGLVNITKAKFHFTNCVKLSQVLKPKDVSQEPWYLLAAKLLQEIRDKLQKIEQERIDAENKPYLDALQPDFERIKTESKKDCKEFLKFVNDSYSPEGTKVDLTEEMLKENQLKRTILRQFIPRFHPDKNVNEDKKTKLLREEICKYLNNLNEQFKQ